MLIVEDDAMLQKLYLRQLQHLGVDADVASSGEEAIALAEKKRYHVILMDVSMPGIDGYATTRLLRQRYSKQELAIIAVTATTNQDACIDAGMNGYYQKPILIDQLREIVDTYLRPPTVSS